MKFTGCLLFLFFTTLGMATQAEETTLPAGEYLTKGGWGSLDIKPPRNGEQDFVLFSLGANAHACNFEGTISNGVAKLDDESPEPACIVKFQREGSTLKISGSPHEACRSYCGMRAGFEGSYLKPAPGCENNSLRQTRAHFKTLYDHKEYARAKRTLAPILSSCKTTLKWYEDWEIRNDLALTEAKIGEGKACRATLKPMIPDANRYLGTEEDRDNICDRDGRTLPPFECDLYLQQIAAAKTNLGWCKRAGG